MITIYDSSGNGRVIYLNTDHVQSVEVSDEDPTTLTIIMAHQPKPLILKFPTSGEARNVCAQIYQDLNSWKNE